MSLIALYSDFGSQSFLIRSHQHLLNAYPVVSVTDELQRFNYAYADYVFKTSVSRMPDHSWHILLFDIFNLGAEYQNTPFIYVPYQNKHLIFPNNGIANYFFNTQPSSFYPIALPPATQLLKDLFQTLCEYFSQTPQVQHSPQSVPLLNPNLPPQLIVYEDKVECRIIFIDDFHNIILNITQGEFEAIRQQRSFRINLMKSSDNDRDTLSCLSFSYNAVKEGDPLARFNEAGYLELSINQGSLAHLLGYSNYTIEAIRKDSRFAKHLYYEPFTIYFSSPAVEATAPF